MTEVHINFAFLREGPSDDGLIPHLRTLLIRAGAASVVGSSRHYPGSVAEKLRLLQREEALPNLVFVHRDADGPDPSERNAEIKSGAEEASCYLPIVPVVPVQELEAWLLLDEGAIRQVAGRPAGKSDLNLPKLKAVEGTTSPKEALQAALLTASDKTGGRLKKERKAFSTRRVSLLERLDVDGAVCELPSWQALVHEVTEVVRKMS